MEQSDPSYITQGQAGVLLDPLTFSLDGRLDPGGIFGRVEVPRRHHGGEFGFLFLQRTETNISSQSAAGCRPEEAEDEKGGENTCKYQDRGCPTKDRACPT